jgi:hypothetical protein
MSGWGAFNASPTTHQTVALLSELTTCAQPCLTTGAQAYLTTCAQPACVQVFAQPPQTRDGGSRTGRDTCNRTALGRERSLGPLVRAEDGGTVGCSAYSVCSEVRA